MNRRRKITRLAAVSLLPLACLLALGCGGGGGDPILPPGLNATWTPDNAAPDVMTINMAAGSSSGASFTFPVQVTGIDGFFGAAFRVTFDPDTAAFAGYSGDGSVIDDGGAEVEINAALGGPGEVLINATRVQDAGGGYLPGVDVGATATLVTLSFRATAATQQPNVFAFSNREVQTCNDATETCDPVPDANLTWSGGSLQAR